MIFGETPLHVIQTREALLQAVEQLSRAPVIGVDTESDGFHRYQEKVSLIQISDLDADFIIDPLVIDDMSPLGHLFENDRQIKVLHGADYDIVSLRRDFGFQFNNMFDTMIAAQFLGLSGVGLADLIRRWFGHVIDKRYQRHDWSARPLLPEHLDYARGDTHFLPALREVLTLRLRQSGRHEQVAEECELLSRRQWQGRTRDPADFLRIKGARSLPTEGLRALRALHRYREEQAAEFDRPPFKVLPDDVLLAIADALPQTADEMAPLFRRGSPLLRRHGDGLLQAVVAGLQDQSGMPVPPPVERLNLPAALSTRESELLLLKLRDWRNQKTEEKGLPPVAVFSNNLLKSLTRLAPETLADLEAVPEIRRWQIAEFGEEVLTLIAEVQNRRESAASGKKRRRRRRGESSRDAENS